MKVTLPVCDQCGAIIGDIEVHKLVHSFSPKFVNKEFNIKEPKKKDLNIFNAEKMMQTEIDKNENK